MQLGAEEAEPNPQHRVFRIFTWEANNEAEVTRLIDEMAVYTNAAGEIWNVNATLSRSQDAGMRGTTSREAQPEVQLCSVVYSDVPQWVQLCSKPKAATGADIVSAEAAAEGLFSRGRTLVRRTAFRVAGRKFKLGDHTVAVGALHKAAGFHSPIVEVLSLVNPKDPSATQQLQLELASGLVSHVNPAATAIVDVSQLTQTATVDHDNHSAHALLSYRTLQYLRIALDGIHEDLSTHAG
jgi:hypothetical protein